MNQTKFEDICSQCGQPCTRVLRAKWTNDGLTSGWLRPVTGTSRFVTSCCGAKPLAVPVVKET